MQICGAVKALVLTCQIVVSLIGAAFDSEASAIEKRASYAASTIVPIIAISTLGSAKKASVIQKYVIPYWTARYASIIEAVIP